MTGPGLGGSLGWNKGTGDGPADIPSLSAAMDELLFRRIPDTLTWAKVPAEQSGYYCNRDRPRSTLEHRPPAAEAFQPFRHPCTLSTARALVAGEAMR